MKFFLIFLIIYSSHLFSKTIKMAFCMNIPPYVMEESTNGFQIEIMQQALKLKGHTLEPIFVTSERASKLLREKSIDALERGEQGIDSSKFYFAKDHTVDFHDMAVTLKKNKMQINHISDLQNKSVIGFKNATFYLGDEFKFAMAKNPKYEESKDQFSQAKMLLNNRSQVLVGDKLIFKYFAVMAKYKNVDSLVDYHEIFSKKDKFTNNHAVFLDKSVRDDFDFGLAKLKANGIYDKIINKYIQ